MSVFALCYLILMYLSHFQIGTHIIVSTGNYTCLYLCILFMPHFAFTESFPFSLQTQHNKVYRINARPFFNSVRITVYSYSINIINTMQYNSYMYIA